MKKNLHRNFHKASILIFISAALGIINVYFSPYSFQGVYLFTVIITFLFVLGIGFLVRFGNSWIKYLLLVFFILGLLGIPSLLKYLTYNPIILFVNIIQTVLQLGAIILLFMIPKKSDQIIDK